MRLSEIYRKILIESLKFKTASNGEFIEYTFSDNSEYIGQINLRLKKGWNQLHIGIDTSKQGMGYSYKMIQLVIDNVDYISIPEGRIINDLVYKIIKKFESDSKYEVWKTKFDEWIISNKKKTREELEGIFN